MSRRGGRGGRFEKGGKSDPFANAVVMGNDKIVQKMYTAARQNGTLKLNNRRLGEFPPVIVNLHDQSNLSADEKWWENVDIQHINLSHNEIPSVPPEIGTLDQLVTLNLAENKLQDIPREMCSLHLLKKLDLSRNNIQNLPELDGLTGLTELLLGNNRYQYDKDLLMFHCLFPV